MNYWQLRTIVSKIVPRQTYIQRVERQKLKEKGRKSNLHQFDILSKKWEESRNDLNPTEMSNFIEVSLRASACPMPLNVDVWDGTICPYNCLYCYANYFRSSLYSSFFDNYKQIGLRYCRPDYFKAELDKYLNHQYPENNSIQKAIKLRIPLRLGIRFENFTHKEKDMGIALELLKYLSKVNYPVMINSKSDLLSEDQYLEALSSNPSRSAVHITLISANEKLIKTLEPGAPPYKKRILTMKRLSEAGIRVIARIEPFGVFLNDDPDFALQYMEDLKQAGVNHLTFDSYSYSAKDYSTEKLFNSIGYDFKRMFLLSSDSQMLSSLLLGKYMEEYRKRGFSCSTFDYGNVPSNNDPICCEVGDWFKGGFNYGSGVTAIRFIRSRPTEPTRWSNFEKYVEGKGGFLSEALKLDTKKFWNMLGNTSFSLHWSSGICPEGFDKDGTIWKCNSKDSRLELLRGLLNE